MIKVIFLAGATVFLVIAALLSIAPQNFDDSIKIDDDRRRSFLRTEEENKRMLGV